MFTYELVEKMTSDDNKCILRTIDGSNKDSVTLYIDKTNNIDINDEFNIFIDCLEDYKKEYLKLSKELDTIVDKNVHNFFMINRLVNTHLNSTRNRKNLKINKNIFAPIELEKSKNKRKMI